MTRLEDEIRGRLAGELRLSLSGSFDFARWSQHSQASEQPVETTNDSTELEKPSCVPKVLIQSIFLGARIADSDGLQSGPQIGVGSSMIVHEGFLDGEKVAIKKWKPQRMGGDGEQSSLKALSLELRVLLSDFIKPHPNIVDLLAVSWIEETQSNGESKLLPLLVMEIALSEARTLHDLIPIVDPLNFELKGFLISDILSGLDAIHRDRFIHGDLKPENVLIFRQSPGDRYTAKLADFGFSDDVEKWPFGVEGNPAGGTDYWNAPECINPNAGLRTCRQPSRDLYSFGLVAWYIVASRLPFGPDRGSDWAGAYETVNATKILDGAASEASEFFCAASGRLGLDLKAGWGEALHQYLGASDNTQPDNPYNPNVFVGVVDELLWRQHNRHAAPGYTANRVFGELSPTMTAALRRSIVSEMKKSTTPILESALRSLELYSSGYPSTEAPSMRPVLLEEMKSWATRPTDDPETISIRSKVLASMHYGHGQDPPTVLNPKAECEVILSGLCLDLYGFEKRSGKHALSDSFRQLLDELVGVFLEEAQLRILRLWHSAYRLAYVAHAIHWSRNILYSRPPSDPQHDPDWNRIAQAIRRDDVRVFRQLLEKKALPEQISLDTAKGTQNLMLLVIEQHLPNILAYLVEQEAVDLNQPLIICDNLMMPVQLACYQGNLDAAATLLTLGADPCSLFEFGFVKECIDSGKMESISFLLVVKEEYAAPRSKPSLKYRDIQTFDFSKKEYDTEIGPRTASPIFIAIAKNSWSTFAELVSIGVDINSPCFGQYNPLQVAVQFRRPLFVAALLDAGADPNVQTIGMTPLHDFIEGFSTTSGKMKWLYGDITWVDSEEQKAVDAERHDQIILELLLRHPKTNLNARDLTGKTPFAAAMEAGQIAWAEKIIQAGGNPMLTMFDGESPLHILALRGMGKEARWLLERWPDMVHSQDYSKRTPIHNAMEAGRDKMIELLLETGYDIMSQDSLGYTILHRTLTVGQIDTFHMIWLKIQEPGKDKLKDILTIQDIFGRTLVHLLAEVSVMRKDDFQPFIGFVENEILRLVNPTEHIDHRGLTPLHFAAASTARVCQMFIDAGFGIDAKDCHGSRPFDLASLASNGATLPLLNPPDNSAPSIRRTSDDGNNSGRVVTILNDHINRVSLAHAKRAELAISELRRAEYGDIAVVLVQAIQVQRMGLLTHDGLFLPYCVFCNAVPVEVEGFGCPLLACVFAAFQLQEEQAQRRNWFVSRAGKLNVRFFNRVKSRKKAGDPSKVDDMGKTRATTDAKPHDMETNLAKPDILAENINKVLSGVSESLKTIVTVLSDPAKIEKVQDGGRVDRICALLSNPDGIRRRALIMSGVWESGLSDEAVKYLVGRPGKV
ncbi:hypothetical protein EPUS_09121 [Endocarpon pusillum Z07020]|uniref:Protein kinase domain-containing protein n=1 Tax=Endocarpon pusillum (strain Z07020 / HMAS-L-300199) TaxID=1263415 RepID=U1GLN5_ENDPU|nr:uncharacterized protein EPUS_09121 [Endocarpon pusillum Z07020]ERF73123.1 hypothetical protein EPUS_09121 [Endocarpon pusillum Z07020]